jgi:hypothetical protein
MPGASETFRSDAPRVPARILSYSGSGRSRSAMSRRRGGEVWEARLFHAGPNRASRRPHRRPPGGDGRAERLSRGRSVVKAVVRPVTRVCLPVLEERVEVFSGDPREAAQLDWPEVALLDELVDEGSAALQREADVANGEQGEGRVRSLGRQRFGDGGSGGQGVGMDVHTHYTARGLGGSDASRRCHWARPAGYHHGPVYSSPLGATVCMGSGANQES